MANNWRVDDNTMQNMIFYSNKLAETLVRMIELGMIPDSEDRQPTLESVESYTQAMVDLFANRRGE